MRQGESCCCCSGGQHRAEQGGQSAMGPATTASPLPMWMVGQGGALGWSLARRAWGTANCPWRREQTRLELATRDRGFLGFPAFAFSCCVILPVFCVPALFHGPFFVSWVLLLLLLLLL